ncbi:MAG: alpha/beta hydrolase [Balneolales bacterium]|nr:alpha/beta hydrolase [Balneolales bacterium]
MKKKILTAVIPAFLVFMLVMAAQTTDARQASAGWVPDVLGEPFEQRTFEMEPDYEGDVVVTLVRRLVNPGQPSEKAVLYVHGFNDYFFQAEMAERFNAEGLDFYAVDLRKYGRSWRPHQKITNVRDLSEYYADLDLGLNYIREAGASQIVLKGHSTGGLTTTLYAADRKGMGLFDALLLNSPFFDFNAGFFMRRFAIPFIAWRGGSNPDKLTPEGEPGFYGASIYAGEQGEWAFNTEWKGSGVRLNYGWIRAIRQGHRRVARGLEIDVPVLVMHSDKTVPENELSEVLFTGDSVLNVAHIKAGARNLRSPDLQLAEIENGMHDLILSREPVRNEAYRVMMAWVRELRGDEASPAP